MKKRFALLVGGMMAFAAATPSVVDAMPYLRASAGITNTGKDTGVSYDTGFNYAVALGTDSGRFRLEGELGHQNNGIKDSAADVSMTTYLANYYVDLLAPVVPIKPYVAIGGGMADVEGKSVTGTLSNDKVFAWQVGVGVGFTMYPLVMLDVQYRHLDAGSPELFGTKYGIASNNVSVGVRIGF